MNDQGDTCAARRATRFNSSPARSSTRHSTGSSNRTRRQHRAMAMSPTISLLMATLVQSATALHHLREPAMHTVNKRDSDLPIRVTNNCKDVLYPAILTQHGVGPDKSGFRLNPGDTSSMTVSFDWRGRIWARTNCTFNSDGSVPQSGQGGAACATGDCGQFVECQGAGQPPATLAEMTMSSRTNQAYYDVSLVDGYNIPLGIISLLSESNNPNLTEIPPNLTNPVCIGTAALLAPVGDTSDETFGSNSSYPIPLEQSLSSGFVQNWCPFPLLQFPPQKPGDGVYPYPDDNIRRPQFSPCYSACARWNKPEYCCTRDHDSPSSCSPSYYSKQAKKVCPDAYSYAYDDQTSTFIVPQGGGFQVVFCPAGRSTNILAVFGDQLRQLAQTGHVSPEIRSLASNGTYIQERNDAKITEPGASIVALVVILVLMCCL